MITVKNHSHEAFRLVTKIDGNAPGCIVRSDMPPEPELIEPGHEIAIIGYQPGVSYVIEPVKRPQIPRNFMQPGGDPYNRVGSRAIP